MERPDVPGTRDKILIAAATMLGEDPTARLSVRAVASRAGVSTGSLRHFVPTQRVLVDTVVAGMHELDLPDDPVEDRTASPVDRLVAGLLLLLGEVGAGEQARRHLGDLYRAYVATPPSEDDAATYLALDRLGRGRIARWLTTLVDEGVIPPGDVEQRARFLATVVDGLATRRALPAEALQVDSEVETLHLAVRAVTAPGVMSRT